MYGYYFTETEKKTHIKSSPKFVLEKQNVLSVKALAKVTWNKQPVSVLVYT